jgi:hypothetical protein
MKPRFAVYAKYRGTMPGKWQCVGFDKNRAAAFALYDKLGDREKKIEKLEVTFVWAPDRVGQP